MSTEISQEELVIGGDEAMEVFIHGVDGDPSLIPQVTMKSVGAPVVDDDRIEIHDDDIPATAEVVHPSKKAPVPEASDGSDPALAGPSTPASNATGLKSIEFEIHDGLPTEEPAAPKSVDADDE